MARYGLLCWRCGSRVGTEPGQHDARAVFPKERGSERKLPPIRASTRMSRMSAVRCWRRGARLLCRLALAGSSRNDIQARQDDETEPGYQTTLMRARELRHGIVLRYESYKSPASASQACKSVSLSIPQIAAQTNSLPLTREAR
jgi:hypothetical protein